MAGTSSDNSVKGNPPLAKPYGPASSAAKPMSVRPGRSVRTASIKDGPPVGTPQGRYDQNTITPRPRGGLSAADVRPQSRSNFNGGGR